MSFGSNIFIDPRWEDGIRAWIGNIDPYAILHVDAQYGVADKFGDIMQKIQNMRPDFVFLDVSLDLHKMDQIFSLLRLQGRSARVFMSIYLNGHFQEYAEVYPRLLAYSQSGETWTSGHIGPPDQWIIDQAFYQEIGLA